MLLRNILKTYLQYIFLFYCRVDCSTVYEVSLFFSEGTILGNTLDIDVGNTLGYVWTRENLSLNFLWFEHNDVATQNIVLVVLEPVC